MTLKPNWAKGCIRKAEALIKTGSLPEAAQVRRKEKKRKENNNNNDFFGFGSLVLILYALAFLS